MSKGIFTAASGAIAQSERLETISNNLANVSTPGFKRDQQVFKEYLSSFEKEPTAITVPRIPASIESFYDLQGGDKSFVDTAGTSTDHSQGHIKATGSPLDLALEGEGYFEVGAPDGVKLTRAGNFSIDGSGRLVTKQGFPVLLEGPPGSPTAAREIRLGKANVRITDAGEVFDGENSLGKISVVGVGNKDALHKFGQNLFGFRENLNAQTTTIAVPQMKQGYLEQSNVNVVKEMTEMIGATRVFESTHRAIQAYDQMAQKLISEVPKLK